MKKLTACLSFVILLASCSVDPKKVIVLSQGTANINTDNLTITTSGTGHEEKTVLFHDEGNLELKLTSQVGTATVNLPEPGVYILNTKSDTIVGSYVNYTAPKTAVEKITDEKMKANIDSLEQIIAGNVSAEKKTFFVLPNKAVKVSSNSNAHIVTPYHQMTSVSTKKGEEPEVYRFYPISEARATLQKLKGMMGDEVPVNDPK
jgi:hypothetical protein